MFSTVVLCTSAAFHDVVAFDAVAAKTPTHDKTTTVHPQEIDDILYNPGIEFADFHFGLSRRRPREKHPPFRNLGSDQKGMSPKVDLAIEGKRDDRWYEISTVTIHD
jgi:hypothetical protein